MPFLKSRLTRAEQEEFFYTAQRLKEQGVDIEIENPVDSMLGLEVQPINGAYDTNIFELEDGRAGYKLDLVITNQTPKTIYSVDVQIRTPWQEEFLEWLTPSQIELKFRKRPDSVYKAYRFPGKLGLEFPPEMVMNHDLLEGGKLLPRRPLHGLLLATGGLMPTHLQHGQWQEVTLAIIGSDHREYTQKITLWTERMEHRAKPIKRRSTLRDGPSEGGALKGVWVPSPGNGPVPDSVSFARASELRE